MKDPQPKVNYRKDRNNAWCLTYNSADVDVVIRLREIFLNTIHLYTSSYSEVGLLGEPKDYILCYEASQVNPESTILYVDIRPEVVNCQDCLEWMHA